MGELNWTRRYSFQSVHALDIPVLRERTHGHQYFLEVTFSGNDIDQVDQVVSDHVLSKLHGFELTGEDFAALTPSTGERIVDWIHQRLEQPLGERLKAVALQETRKNRFVSSLSEARYV